LENSFNDVVQFTLMSKVI